MTLIKKGSPEKTATLLLCEYMVLMNLMKDDTNLIGVTKGFDLQNASLLFEFVHRLNSIDAKYQIWKLGVVFTDNVSVHIV